MTAIDPPESHDLACFRVLAEEFDDDPKTTARKIRCRLKALDLGTFDNEHVEHLRCLKNELFTEIRRFEASEYFVDNEGTVAASSDFDGDRMALDYGKRYPSIDAIEMRGMVAYAVYLFYLR